MRPWGPIDWLLPKLPRSERKLHLLGCISSEERCQAIPLLASNKNAQSIILLRINDPPSRYSDQIAKKIRDIVSNMHASGLIDFRQVNIELFVQDELIAKCLTDLIPSDQTSEELDLWLDITCLPKRFFFLLVKLALQSPLVKTLIVTYTQPSPGRYTEEPLAEDPENVQPLPGLGPNFEEPETVIIAAGFESLGIPQLLEEYRDKKREIILLLPFPPGQPYSRRVWNVVRSIADSIDHPQIKRIDAVDACNAVLGEVVAQLPAAAEIARPSAGFPDHQPREPDPRGFLVLAVDPVVADVRLGQQNGLTPVRGIGEDLLVAGHRCVEDQLAGRFLSGAKTATVQDGAVFEHQACWIAGGNGHSKAGSMSAMRLISAAR